MFIFSKCVTVRDSFLWGAYVGSRFTPKFHSKAPSADRLTSEALEALLLSTAPSSRFLGQNLEYVTG
jgi:hypothetical protein